MPKRRYERKAPTRAWSHIRPLLKDAAQIKDALIRPVILWGVNVKERAVAVLLPGRAVSWGKTIICPPLAHLYLYSCRAYLTPSDRLRRRGPTRFLPLGCSSPG